MTNLSQSVGVRLTHGRHCPCSACAHQDWSEPQLAPCGMHGHSCARIYQPINKPLGTLIYRCEYCGGISDLTQICARCEEGD